MHESYSQYNTLCLMSILFQHVFPSVSEHNEEGKQAYNG